VEWTGIRLLVVGAFCLVRMRLLPSPAVEPDDAVGDMDRHPTLEAGTTADLTATITRTLSRCPSSGSRTVVGFLPAMSP
jgi:hypothetical protein